MTQEQAIAIADRINEMLDDEHKAAWLTSKEPLVWCVSLYEGYGTDASKELLRIMQAEIVSVEIRKLELLYEMMVSKRNANTRVAELSTTDTIISYHNGMAHGFREAAKELETALEALKHGLR